MNALRQYKHTITLSQIQREVLVGTLLGDACLYLSKGKPRLSVQFEQTIARSEYIWHLYSVFENFVDTPPRIKKNRGGAKARDYQSICFQTFGHPVDKVHRIQSSTQPMNTKVYAEKKEFLKILTTY